MSASEDKSLVLAAQNDPREFAALYRKYYEQVYRFCYYRLNRHRELTEDVVSDVFIKALENVASYQDRVAPFIVWLYTIARHLIVDHYRSGKVRMAGSSASLEWTGTGEDVHKDTEERDLKRTVMELIPSLPDEDQELLSLRFTSELGFAELGKVLGITEGAAKMRYSRAVEKLKAILEGDVSRGNGEVSEKVKTKKKIKNEDAGPAP